MCKHGQRAPITLVSVDDHLLIRAGIRRLLEAYDGLCLVGEGGAGEEIEPLLAVHRPDILLLDIGLPRTATGSARQPGERYPILPAIRRLTQQWPETQIIVLSQYDDGPLVEMVMAAGVRGYLLKDDALSVALVEAICTVHGGGRYCSPQVQALLEGDAAMSPGLTPRQLEILTALATQPHCSRAEVAAHLGISEHTVSHHLRLLFENLGVNNLTAAIVVAMQRGLLPRALVVPARSPGVEQEV